jgi:3',5'-nucleoside bisphosphate phosphatase
MGGTGIIDLHSHSRASDGQFTPAEVAVRARAAGCAVWALCDHDTVAGLESAADAARRVNVRLVPGIELSAFLERHEIHLLGHFVDPASPTLRDFEDFLAARRRERMKLMVERLAALGVHVTEAAIEQHSGGKTIGRPHVARAIVESGAVATVKEAFDRFLGEGQPAYVQRYRLEAADAVALVRGAGGTVTIAHPGVSKLEVGEPGRGRRGGDRGDPPRPEPVGAREVPPRRRGPRPGLHRRLRLPWSRHLAGPPPRHGEHDARGARGAGAAEAVSSVE